MVEVNSETDFVARNDLFQGLVKMVANVALDVGTDVEKIKAAKAGTQDDRRSHLRDHRQDRREHDAAPRRRAFGRQGRDRQLCHNRCPRASARSVSWSRWNRPARPTSLPRLAGMLAMHVAAANPQAVDAAGLDPERCAREGRAGRQVQGAGQARQRDREDRGVGLKTFYKEVCLLEQAYVHDDKKSVRRR